MYAPDLVLSPCDLSKSIIPVLQRQCMVIKWYSWIWNVYILSSGNPVLSDIENDVLSAEEAGRLERDKFVSEMLQKKAMNKERPFSTK